MKHLSCVSLTTVNILFTSCGPSSNTSTPQKPNVPQPQPQPQPEATQKVVTGHLTLDGQESENLFPTIEWKYLTHISASFVGVKAGGTPDINPVRKRIESIHETTHRHNVKILIFLAKNSPGEFITAINDSGAGKELIQQITASTKEYKLGGFDIDYEEYDNWDRNLPSLLVFARGSYLAKKKNMLITCTVNSRWLDHGTEWEQYSDYVNLMSHDRGAFTDRPVQHASHGDFVKDPKHWNEQRRASESKIMGGLPSYGYSREGSLQDAVDDVRGIRYGGILKHLGNETADKDDIGKVYYNGRPTIANKCKFIKENDYTGVMTWQLFQDTHNDNYDLKLVNVVGRGMMEQTKYIAFSYAEGPILLRFSPIVIRFLIGDLHRPIRVI